MRVALTGCGLVCSLGNSVADAWPRIARGERGIGPVTLFEVDGQRTTLAAEVHGLAVPAEPVGGYPWSRTDALALVAAREALAEARLDPRRSRVGLVVGGTTGGMFETERILARMHIDRTARVPMPEMLAHPLSATADRLGKALGPFVRARSLCSACSSGANAFALGAAWLALDLVDAVLVGGTDGLCRLTFTGFNALGAIDPSPSRPFDARRRGLSIGEGAGFAVLERADRATARGVGHAVELVGAGITSDAHHITNPAEDGEQPARAIALALSRAGLTPSDIDYVNAHGTGTPLNDSMEARALGRALGSDASRIYVSSTKAQIGHTLGAAGAIEAVIAALTVRDGRVPPTAGLEEVDPACAGLRHVTAGGLEVPVRAALSNAFGFGGVDTVLAFARAGFAPEHAERRRAVVVTGVGSASRLGALAGAANAALVGPAVPEAADPTATLDAARARRLDRGARLAAVAASLASTSPDDGVVLGTAYGETDGSAAFLARVEQKGPRLAPPADFPNLVPSAPSGHASIYLGLHGPTIAVADLSSSGEAAVATAFELVAAGEADAIVAGSVEPPSDLVARAIAPMFRAQERGDPLSSGEGRTEGAAVVRLAAAPGGSDASSGRGAIVVAVVAQGADAAAAIAGLGGGAPSPRAVLVTAEATASVRAAVEASPWARAAVREVCESVGRHEGLGGFAVAAAAALLMRGDFDEALVLGRTPGRAYAIRLHKS